MAVQAEPQAGTAPSRNVWDQLRGALDEATYRPTRREGLEWRRFTTVRGEDYAIVQNPEAATYLRLGDDELFLFELMDGSRTVQDLVVQYMLRYRRFALPRVQHLVADLRRHQFLTDRPRYVYRELQQRAAGRRVGRFVESYAKSFVQREFPVAGIDRVLSALYRGGGWVLYTRPARLLATLVALVGVPLFVWQFFVHGAQLRVGGSVALGVLLYYASFVVVAVVHELAHAFTVKSYGRVVRRGGLSIFYGAPGLYVDTQDVWMEPRRRRIATSFAGPFSGLVMTALAGIALVLLPEGGWHRAVSVFGVSSLINNLVQLMPLIQLDGYYMLMDWLEMPNLRSRALAFVKHDLWHKLRRRSRLTREERVLAVFGALAAVYLAYTLVGGAGFLWLRARSAVDDVTTASSFGGMLLGLAVLVVLTPLVLVIGSRLRNGAHMTAAALRRLAGLAGERLYRERVVLLSQVPALAALGKAQVQWLARRARDEHHAAGARVVRQGELVDAFRVIVSGTVEVVADNGDEATVLGSLGPLDYLGEQSLLAGAPSPVTVRATSALRLLVIGVDDFRARVAPHVARDAVLRERLRDAAELDRFSLFSGLGAKERDLLLTRLEPERRAAGEAVVRQGDVGDRFWLIRAGRLVATVQEEGVESTVRELGPGEWFGETALLLDVGHPATVRAQDDVRLWGLDRHDFTQLLGRYLNLGGALEMAAAERLAEDQDSLGASASTRWLDVEVGDAAPDLVLPSVQGSDVRLADLQGRTVLLWFSRGYNCPFCRRYMAQLAADLDRFEAAGIQLLQVAPNLLETARCFWGGQELPWPFLCDPDKSAYRLCGLCDLGAGEANRNTVKGFAYAFGHGDARTTLRGVWLDVMNRSFGERVQHHALTAMQQGVFLVDAGGVIRRKWVFAPLDPVPTNDELLAAARAVE